jgi:hypothetical protein
MPPPKGDFPLVPIVSLPAQDNSYLLSGLKYNLRSKNKGLTYLVQGVEGGLGVFEDS